MVQGRKVETQQLIFKKLLCFSCSYHRFSRSNRSTVCGCYRNLCKENVCKQRSCLVLSDSKGIHVVPLV